MTARTLLTAYALIAALASAWLARSTTNAPEAVKPPKWWVLFDVFLAVFWPIGLYVWARNTDVQWANCTTRDGWNAE